MTTSKLDRIEYHTSLLAAISMTISGIFAIWTIIINPLPEDISFLDAYKLGMIPMIGKVAIWSWILSISLFAISTIIPTFNKHAGNK